MDKKLPIALLVASACLHSGCAIKNPFAPAPKPSPIGANGQINSINSANARPAIGQPIPKPEPDGPVTSTFKKAGSSIANAFSFKPKVIKADDPTNLHSNPGPIGAEVFVAAGKLQEERGNAEKAKEQYRQALQRDPKNLKALLSLARVHDRSQEFDQAIILYRQAIAAHPRVPIAYNDLALCYARQGKSTDAARMLTQATRLDPQNPRYRNNMAIVLIEMGRIQEAHQQLAVVNPPAVAHYNVGVFLYQRDRIQEATQQFSRAVDLDPDLTAAQQMLRTISSRPPKNRQSSVTSEEASKVIQASAVFEVPVPAGKTPVADNDEQPQQAVWSNAEVDLEKEKADEEKPKVLPTVEEAKPIGGTISDDGDEPKTDQTDSSRVVGPSKVTESTYE